MSVNPVFKIIKPSWLDLNSSLNWFVPDLFFKILANDSFAICKELLLMCYHKDIVFLLSRSKATFQHVLMSFTLIFN